MSLNCRKPALTRTLYTNRPTSGNFDSDYNRLSGLRNSFAARTVGDWNQLPAVVVEQKSA